MSELRPARFRTCPALLVVLIPVGRPDFPVDYRSWSRVLLAAYLWGVAVHCGDIYLCCGAPLPHSAPTVDNEAI